MTRKNKVLWGRFFNSLNVFNAPRTLRSFNSFDEVTRFRLINSFVVAFGFSMLGPVMTVLQGTLMLAWIIALFHIIEMVAVKTNELFVHSFTTERLFHLTVILHLLYTLTALTYYWNPILMVYLDSFFALVETMVIGAYSIKLNNYIAKSQPKSMSRFQIVRNSSWADGALIGLFISTLTLYFYELGVTLGLFLVVNMGFTVWLFSHWNFYKGKIKE